MEKFKTYEEYREKLIALGKRVGFNLDLDNPKTIQDKINWMKIYDSTPLKSLCTDKVLVHEYCKEKLGDDICIPIIKTYNSTQEINWNDLPEQFVIKCNHGSGMNIIVKDKEKLNKQEAIKKLDRWLKEDFSFRNGYEMHYSAIKRKILVEQFMEDGSNGSLLDYKFWCFNGEPKFMTISDGFGHGTMNFYDMNFKKNGMSRTDFKPMKIEPKKPKTFDDMVNAAKILSDDFKFVRVDFYEINGKMYLGELTFTPGVGFFKFSDKKYDRLLGDWVDLSDNKVTRKNENTDINIISHNCVGARIYQELNKKYCNPFAWCIVPPEDFLYLYENYKNINFNKYCLSKDGDYYKIIIDDKVSVFYPHYKFDPKALKPVTRIKDGIDIYYNQIDKYILEKYNTRISRMTGAPIFIVTDREFIVNKRFNFTSNDLLKYVNKPDCVVVTADKTIKGENVIYVKSKKLDPLDLAKIILKNITF